MFTDRRTFTLGAAALTASGFGAAPSFASTSYEPGMIFGVGPEGRCDDDRIGGPSVVWNEDEQLWWMYYYCRDKNFPKDVAPGFGTGSIALAKSVDGISWERFDGPLKGGAVMVPSEDPDAFDATHIGVGNVIRHENEWIMFYWGGDSTIPKEIEGNPVHEGYQYKGYRCRSGVARSADGVNWTRVKGKGYGGAAVDIGVSIYGAFPTGFYDGERFVLYYTGLSSKIFYWQTHIVTSTDLVNWEDAGVLKWSDGAALWERSGMVTRSIQPNFLRGREKWLMIYTGLDGRISPSLRVIGAAVSNDAINWRHVYDEPIFYPAPINRWDGGGVAVPNVVRVGNKLHMYYYGFPHARNKISPQRGIGLAISENRDLRNFLRVTT